MFCGLRFKCRLLLNVVSFSRPSGIPFGTICEKNVPKIASNKTLCPMAPRDAASRVHFSTVAIARARFVVRIRINICLSLLQLQLFQTNRKIARKRLLELASIAKVSKTIRKLERADIKSTFLMICTRLGQRPDEFSIKGINQQTWKGFLALNLKALSFFIFNQSRASIIQTIGRPEADLKRGGGGGAPT